MTQPRPKGRWMKWALIVSLAVNMAIAAAVVGAVVTGGPDGRAERSEGRRGGGPPEIAALARGLEREDRRALFAALRENGRLAGGRETMRAARDQIVAALRSDPFDRAAFERAMQEQRALQADLADRGIAVLSDIIAGLDADDRAALAERITSDRRER